MPADPDVDIAVFARAPIAGQAKTRLIPRLGAAGAARLQRQLTERALARARAVRAARVTLWTTADDADTRALARPRARRSACSTATTSARGWRTRSRRRSPANVRCC